MDLLEIPLHLSSDAHPAGRLHADIQVIREAWRHGDAFFEQAAVVEQVVEVGKAAVQAQGAQYQARVGRADARFEVLRQAFQVIDIDLAVALANRLRAVGMGEGLVDLAKVQAAWWPAEMWYRLCSRRGLSVRPISASAQ